MDIHFDTDALTLATNLLDDRITAFQIAEFWGVLLQVDIASQMMP